MKPLPFYITPFTKEMAARQLVAHTARGLAWMLTTPADAPTVRHRLDLPTVLGIGYHVKWYAAPSRHSGKLTTQQTRDLLYQASKVWSRPLNHLDVNAVDLAIAALPDASVELVMKIFGLCLEYLAFTKQERAYVMNLSANQLPPDIINKLEMSLASLEQSLIAKDIMMPTHLRAVHSLLITYPESVHLLEDAEIARIIDGAEIMTKTEIVKAAAPKQTRSKKISADDL